MRRSWACQASLWILRRKVISDAAFGPDYKFFSHRVGRGIGMDGHERPYLVRGNALPLAPNMTFGDEPGIYIPGEFGVRLEDHMYIGETERSCSLCKARRSNFFRMTDQGASENLPCNMRRMPTAQWFGSEG